MYARKKAACLVLAVCMSLTAVPALAADGLTGEMGYTQEYAAVIASGSCGAKATWSLDGNGTLTISGSGEMDNYTEANSAPYAKYSDKIQSVVVQTGISRIGEEAFYGCTALRSVSLSSGVKSIGMLAFGKTSLTEITLPISVKTIEAQAFWRSSLESIIIPENVQEIGSSAFARCSGLKTVWIGRSVKKIGNAAFHACPKLQAIYFYGSAPVMGDAGSNNIFDGAIVTAYYPENAGWDAAARQQYGGSVDWKVWEPTFADVAQGKYYSNAVQWAVKNGITSGTTTMTFSPSTGCTRAQAVTFLWNAAGKPIVSGVSNPFKDVKSDAYYYNAVLWAKSKGITSGTSATTFSPSATCTRAQIVTFLWNQEGKVVTTGSSAFKDVKTGAYYEDAVNWAVKNRITSGTSATTFSPSATCTRGQIVTFLYNYMA
ncbi:MAG: S-layer homology domain-containing protein [Eubacteriales bacterium]|nr:S-layer homology domain-containing protein [Eubacteriales bacterium]